MDEQTIRAYWKTLNHELRATETSRARGDEADAQTIIGLAARVIEGVNALSQQSKTMLLRQEYASAFISAYQPLPSKPAQEPRAYTILDAAFALR